MTKREWREPSIQSVPMNTTLAKEIKEAFTQLKATHTDADYSAIEQRIAETLNNAGHKEDPNMMLLSIQEGGSAHLPLIGSTPAETVLKELVEFAKKKENWFSNPAESAEAAKTRTDPRPEGGHHAPMSRHITVKNASDSGEETYHISFTITSGMIAPSKPDGTPDIENAKTLLFRHATLGVGNFERLVDPIEAFTVLKFLGFKTLDPRSVVHPDFTALVFLEPLPPEEEAELRASVG